MKQLFETWKTFGNYRNFYYARILDDGNNEIFHSFLQKVKNNKKI